MFIRRQLILLLLSGLAVTASTQGKKSSLPDSVRYPCRYDSNYSTLDFWVGTWDVFDKKGDKVGTNMIEKILSDCAVIENWEGSSGYKGKSLFYYHQSEAVWKQVWVTEYATSPRGLKEKVLVKRFAGGRTRFQGELEGPKGTILDRTTLTPLLDGRVKQVIEVSADDGETWNMTFEAYYVRQGG